MRTEPFESGEIPGELVADEGYYAFNPAPLPPNLEMESGLVLLLSEAQQAIGELGGIGRTVENPNMLIRPFIRKEAVLSSRIEGTRADLSDVYALEAGQENLISEPQRGDAREVFNYVRATEVGLGRLDGANIDVELIKDLHEILMDGVRGEKKTPGEFRTTQNFIGPPGAGVEDARFVPPPPQLVPYAMEELEDYLYEDKQVPPLIEMGLVHYQFETIHPFLDGNGRIGRLLITLMMCEEGFLPQPFLYLSAYFNRNRREYIDRLFGVSAYNEWEEWLKFFLRGVKQQAQEAFVRSNELRQLKEKYRKRYQDSQSPTLLKLVYELFSKPQLTVKQASDMLDVTYPAANSAIETLDEDGVLTEITGKSRNRMFRAEEIYTIIMKDFGGTVRPGDSENRGRQSDLRDYQ